MKKRYAAMNAAIRLSRESGSETSKIVVSLWRFHWSIMVDWEPGESYLTHMPVDQRNQVFIIRNKDVRESKQ